MILDSEHPIFLFHLTIKRSTSCMSFIQQNQASFVFGNLCFTAGYVIIVLTNSGWIWLIKRTRLVLKDTDANSWSIIKLLSIIINSWLISESSVWQPPVPSLISCHVHTYTVYHRLKQRCSWSSAHFLEAHYSFLWKSIPDLFKTKSQSIFCVDTVLCFFTAGPDFTWYDLPLWFGKKQREQEMAWVWL